MPVVVDKPISLTSKPSISSTSDEPNADEPTKKLLTLNLDRSTTLRDNEPSLIQHDQAKTIDANGNTNDSGYTSAASTPHTNKSDATKGRFAVTVTPRPSLKIIDKPIPDSLCGCFIDFKKLYTEAIWKAVSSRLHRNPGDISMKLRYLGESEQDARLYIIVQCRKRVLRKIKKFFDEPDVKEALGHDFRVHFVDSDLIRLTDTQTVMVCGQEESWPDREQTICGTTINMVLGDEFRRATLGGMIMVKTTTEKLFYGLTAGHPLASLCPDLSDGASDWSDDETGSEDDESDEDYASIQLAVSTEDPFCTEIGSPRDMMVVGPVVADSFRSSKNEANYDWALIDISPKYWAPNRFPGAQYTPAYTKEYKKTTTTNRGEPTSEEMPNKELHSSTLEPHLSKESVVVITSRGLLRGTLSSNQSVLLISPSNDFVETLDFLPRHTSDLVAGDSGSWVVDEKTAEVYGHIVAVDALGEAHVMPMRSTLRDIQCHFGALEVDIPIGYDVLISSKKSNPSSILTSRQSRPTAPVSPARSTRRPSIPHSTATAGRFNTINGMHGLMSGPGSGFTPPDRTVRFQAPPPHSPSRPRPLASPRSPPDPNKPLPPPPPTPGTEVVTPTSPAFRPETVLPRLTRLRLQDRLRNSGRTGVSTEEILSIDGSGHRTADDILLGISHFFNELQPPSQLESDVVMQDGPLNAAAPLSDPVEKELTEIYTDNKKRLAERRRRRAVNGSQSKRAHPKPRR